MEHNDSSINFHVIPLIDDTDCQSDDDNTPPPVIPSPSKKFIRDIDCSVLSKEKCSSCKDSEREITLEEKQKAIHAATLAKAKAPLSKTDRKRVEAALIKTRIECKQTKRELEKIKRELEKRSVEVDMQLGDDLETIFSSAKEVTPFMKLFWKQQMETRKASSKNVRYHPMLIRYCLSLFTKSRSVYEELRSSGILVLPSSRTLQDYKNYINPKTGFSSQVLNHLKELTKEYFDIERYIVLLFDEMKIKPNLVFNKHTGELKGFLDLGCAETDFSTLGRETDWLATHTLFFYLRRVITDLRYSFAYFATDGAISIQLMALFWEAVAILEYNCNLWVIGATCEGHLRIEFFPNP